MKALVAAASATVLASVFPAAAQAQDTTGTTFYGNLGYAHTDAENFNVGAIQGRLGARFGQYFGVEGEGSIGVKGDNYRFENVLPDVDWHVKMKHQAAIYGVGFLPISPNTDLLARVGYGTTKLKTTVESAGTEQSASDSEQSWNFGVGAQHHFDGLNGVRADYTRQEFRGDGGGSANVWSLGYTRRF
jgi:opacity protein-like surface antigen